MKNNDRVLFFWVCTHQDFQEFDLHCNSSKILVYHRIVSSNTINTLDPGII